MSLLQRALLFMIVLLCIPTLMPAQEAPKNLPVVSISEVRGARSEAVNAKINAEFLDPGTRELIFEVDLGHASIANATIAAGSKLPPASTISIKPSTAGTPRFLVSISSKEDLPAKGQLATVGFTLPEAITRGSMRLLDVRMISAGGETATIDGEYASFGTSMITKPVTLFAFFAGVVAMIYWVSSFPTLGWFFRYAPPLIWMYFIPMISTTIGITPDISPLYSPFMSRVILPAVLVLLLIPSDVRSIAKLGPKAVIVMLIATTGIAVGAIVSFWIFHTIMPDALPKDTWKGVAALAGSWIGGSPNMFAVLESVGTPPNIIGPLVVVDTVLAYSWLGLLIALSSYQTRIDKYHGADSSTIDAIAVKLEEEQAANARAPRTADIAYMVGIAFVVSQICLAFGGPIYSFFTNTLDMKLLGEVINSYGWGILLITFVGLMLSMTKVRRLDYCGASSLGYVGLYLLLTTYGAQANLRAILEVPAFFALGFVWLLIHIAFLYFGIRITKAPLFLGATSSMANIGGTASAPVVAASYNPTMAPVGLLMAILGGTLGTPVALFIIGTACRAIAGG